MTRFLSLLQGSATRHLGPLEQQLLTALWSRGSATVRELLEDGEIKLAYTTVMTTLDRLYKKHLLDRVAEGRAYRYTPRFTETELEKAAVSHTVRQMLESSAGAPSAEAGGLH